MTSEKLPTSPEEVTLPWLKSVLGNNIKAFEFHREHILNESASKLFVTLTYEDESAVSTKDTKPIRGQQPPKIVLRKREIDS